MRSPPTDLSASQVAEVTDASWGLRLSRLRFLPVGGGSHHWAADTGSNRYFLTADDLRTKPWLGADPDIAFAGLRAAFDTARALHARSGLRFVAAPLPTPDGQTVVRVNARYSLAVFPFIGGRGGQWGARLTAASRDRLARLLARLHLATPMADDLARRSDLRLHQRPSLEEALGELGTPWTGGPFSEHARRLHAEHAGTVQDWLRSFDELAQQMADGNGTAVITHGEPHPGNFLRAGGRRFLVDWDTVALAPAERDLWMLDDGTPGAFAAYTEATGRTISTAAIHAYRLRWILADVASFTALLRSAHVRSADTEHALAALTASLATGQSATTKPYRYL